MCSNSFYCLPTKKRCTKASWVEKEKTAVKIKTLHTFGASSSMERPDETGASSVKFAILNYKKN